MFVVNFFVDIFDPPKTQILCQKALAFLQNPY